MSAKSEAKAAAVDRIRTRRAQTSKVRRHHAGGKPRHVDGFRPAFLNHNLQSYYASLRK